MSKERALFHCSREVFGGADQNLGSKKCMVARLLKINKSSAGEALDAIVNMTKLGVGTPPRPTLQHVPRRSHEIAKRGLPICDESRPLEWLHNPAISLATRNP